MQQKAKKSKTKCVQFKAKHAKQSVHKTKRNKQNKVRPKRSKISVWKTKLNKQIKVYAKQKKQDKKVCAKESKTSETKCVHHKAKQVKQSVCKTK